MLSKTALHMHTTNSDGLNRPASMIEEYYRQGFDIICITEHNVMTANWTVIVRGLTPERFAEISHGVGRGGRGMLQIPYTTEQSRHHHINTYFVNYQNPTTGASIAASLGAINAQPTVGLSHFNHCGRNEAGYTRASVTPSESNNPTHINNYRGYLEAYETCMGIEIINKKDDETRNDRPLWDNINRDLDRTQRNGRFAWGFANDDAHNTGEVGFSYNMLWMNDLNEAEFRKALQDGSFYAVAKVARNEGFPVAGADLSVPVPVITAITVTASTITIAAEHYTRIDWLIEGTTVVYGFGNVFPKSSAAGHRFIRANVVGPGGIAFTQPVAL